MKAITKWVLIIWSLIGLFFLCGSLYFGADIFSELESGYEILGGGLGISCFLGFIFLIWLVIALPALVIYLVSGRKETTKVEIIEEEQQSNLCNECGKYYEGQPKFCPNCGKPISTINSIT